MESIKTLKDHVYEYIAEEIQAGNLGPDERINETVICEKLNISRTPVREALIQLASEGILNTNPRKGFSVKAVSEKDAEELYRIVGALDGLACALALDKLTERDLNDLDFYIDSMYLAIDKQNYNMYQKLQKQFHQFYIDRSGNDMLIEQLRLLKNKFLHSSYLDDLTEKNQEILRMTNREHEELMKLIRKKDADAVRRYLEDVHWRPANAAYEKTESRKKGTRK